MEYLDFIGGPGEIVLRLGAATLIGCLLGLDRELRDKPAGMRTHGLVCLGSALITLASLEITFTEDGLDGEGALRAVQGLMAGIGFLGGGVILRDSDRSSVQGLTTAASIWVVACLGIACGMGLWITTLTAVGLTLLVLTFGIRVEKAIRRRFGPVGSYDENKEGEGTGTGSRRSADED
jgi:putative Mg2+ transporter-C (MgtC) family protein